MSGKLLSAQDRPTQQYGPGHRLLPATPWKGIVGPRPGRGVEAEAMHSVAGSRHILRAWRGAEDADIAVFRFTLGIPGFNDALLPRLVGLLGAALLFANHLSDQGSATAAQVRTECLGAALSVLCIATPSVGSRLQAAQPGRGRTAGSADQSSGQAFQIAPDLPDYVKTELAWASYSLLRNTNSSGALVAASTGTVHVVRGAVRQAAGAEKGPAVLDRVQKDLQQALDTPSSPMVEALSNSSSPVYFPDAPSLTRAGFRGGLLGDSACSALVQPLRPLPESATSRDGADRSTASRNGQSRADSSGNGSSDYETNRGEEAAARRGEAPAAGILMLWSDRPRALSQRERLWAAAIAAKLYDTLS